nr:tRNA (N(6)-L-threonylcarbamoyladenosine(37)-C(2))-methylthiotransferase MtaB [Bacteroidota bacterium]
MQKTVAFHTLGCKLNFTDTSAIAKQFVEAGYNRMAFEQVADVYVVNTCSVTENADKECKSIINKIQRQAPEALVVITGCYAQLKPHYIAEIPGVDLVIGANAKFNIVEHVKNITQKGNAQVQACDIDTVENFVAAQSDDERTRVFLKVQDGCNYTCSFCTIPLARGHSRSDEIENIIARIKTSIKKGAKEIVLAGVNTGDFGIDPQTKKRTHTLLDLLQAIENENFDIRFRTSSIEPNLLTDEIIELIATSNVFMPHFHIPLQSGSDKMLKSMRRRYLTDLYTARVSHIRKLIPHACIGVDVITGFAGEDETDFIDTYNYLHQLDISCLHVFTYSERAETHAITLGNVVPMHIRKARTQKLRMLSHQKQMQHYAQHIGDNRPVLFESGNKRNATIEGFTDNYIKVSHAFDHSFINTIVDCNLVGINENNDMTVTIQQTILV